MSNPLRAAYYPDNALYQTVTLLENVQLARDTYRVRLECPDVARRIWPGQFIMMRMPGSNDPLSGRPLALYDTVLDEAGQAVGLDIVYLTLGRFTRKLARLVPGDQITFWGPLGNGFGSLPAEHLIMVAGGIGQTPFVALAQEHLGLREYGSPPRQVPISPQVTLCYGARAADYLAGVEDFQRIGVDVRLSTDDGSRGHHGFVTDLLEQTLDDDTNAPRIVCCGPEAMMEAVTKIALNRDVPCDVSLETPMSCGIGICFTCVAKVRDDDGAWDYKRTCVEGPVFDARKIVW